MIELAILKTYDSANHRASVQLAGSLTTYLDAIPVSVAIAPAALVIGNRVILAIPGGNIRDAVIIATWPGGTPPAAGDLFALTRFLRTSRYHVFPLGANATFTLDPNILHAIPYISPIPRTVTRIAIQIVTAVAGNARLGIYQDGGGIYPGSRILDAGEVATGTTGLREITGLNVSLLANTLYWLALVTNASGPVVSAMTAGQAWPLLGYGATLHTSGGNAWSVSFTYGALPATYPTGGGVMAGNAIKIAIFF
jgi:hypothetical protein